MNRLKVIGIALVLFTAMSVSAQKQVKWSEVTVQTDGHGQHCKDRIEGSIAYEKGVKDVDYELSTAKVKITYDAAKTSPDNLQAALRKMGYTVKVVPASAANTKTDSKPTSQPSSGGCHDHSH